MQLTPSQRALVRRRTKPAEGPDPAGGELNVIPFLDIVVNLIMFLLVTTASVVAIAQVEAQLPTHGPPCGGGGCAEPGLDLSVTLTRAGIVVAGSGGKLAPGCRELASGAAATVPLAAGGGFDFATLSTCAERVSERFPEERDVIVSADPDIAYEDVISAIDALRADGDRPLFPNVLVSAGVR